MNTAVVVLSVILGEVLFCIVCAVVLVWLAYRAPIDTELWKFPLLDNSKFFDEDESLRRERSSKDILIGTAFYRDQLDASYHEIIANEGIAEDSYEADDVFLAVMNGDINQTVEDIYYRDSQKSKRK